MINRYARKLLILSLGIMLLTKSNLCKKASCWERVGKRSSGVCEEEQRGRRSRRHVGGLPSAAGGGDRRLQMDTSRSGLLAHTYLHCARLRATKPEFAESHLQDGSAAIQTQSSSPCLSIVVPPNTDTHLGTIPIGIWEWQVILPHWEQKRQTE